jgi:hypothetical protein
MERDTLRLHIVLIGRTIRMAEFSPVPKGLLEGFDIADGADHPLEPVVGFSGLGELPLNLGNDPLNRLQPTPEVFVLIPCHSSDPRP